MCLMLPRPCFYATVATDSHAEKTPLEQVAIPNNCPVKLAPSLGARLLCLLVAGVCLSDVLVCH